MKLKVKDIDTSAGGNLVAILSHYDAALMDVYAGDRIIIRNHKPKKDTTAFVDIDLENRHIKKGEIGMFEELLAVLGLKQGDTVEVSYARQPKSLQYIREKLDSKELSEEKIREIINNIVKNKFASEELTYFVSACYTNGLSLRETAYLTKAIVDSGKKLNFNSKIILDKHCAGGIPNNRTTMVVTPIIAAMGYLMPKTSSRSITSPAGTADTMEVLAPVSLSEKKILETVKKTNACMIWGGSVNLAAADDYLIRVRHPLSLDPEGLLLASILAKKKAVGATHVLIDLPYGPEAKFKSLADARNLGRKFVALGRFLGMKIKVVCTDGSQPIGNGIGPALEAKDVISVLKGNGPKDLREKSIFLATEMLKMIKVKQAKEKVLETLDSGKAYRKFIEIIEAQGGKKGISIPQAKFSYEVKSAKSGRVIAINNKIISNIARIAGAPEDKAAGLYMRVKKGDGIGKNDVLLTVYSDSKDKLSYAVKAFSEGNAITLR